jgi:hypothetical protein
VISLILVALAYDEVWSSLVFLKRVYRKTKSWSALWDAFWGRGSETANSAAFEGTKG